MNEVIDMHKDDPEWEVACTIAGWPVYHNKEFDMWDVPIGAPEEAIHDYLLSEAIIDVSTNYTYLPNDKALRN